MPAGLPEPRGFGSPFLPAQVSAVHAPFCRSRGIAVCGLLALLLLSVPARALADAEATDRHEIPTFVLDRIDVMTDAVHAPCLPPCDRPDSSAHCVSQGPGTPIALRTEIRPHRFPPMGCSAYGADR